MRIVLLTLLGGSTAISVDRSRDVRTLDRMTGGYDKNRRGKFERMNGTSPAPQILGNIFTTRDECNNGIVDCADYQCDKCGSCCGDGLVCKPQTLGCFSRVLARNSASEIKAESPGRDS